MKSVEELRKICRINSDRNLKNKIKEIEKMIEDSAKDGEYLTLVEIKINEPEIIEHFENKGFKFKKVIEGSRFYQISLGLI